MTTNPIVKALEGLRSKVNKTRHIRFEASRRLKYKQDLSTVSVAIFSVYGIGFNIFPSIFLSQTDRDMLPVVSTLVSAFVLVISLFEASRGYAQRAYELHNCSILLTALIDKIDLVLLKNQTGTLASSLEVELEKLQAEYLKILIESKSNHDYIDYLVYNYSVDKSAGWRSPIYTSFLKHITPYKLHYALHITFFIVIFYLFFR
ncbi:SLATT domain-containing protein [Calidithermus chliarophilus]|uniref:SLATT domain-containing protein n=1 Tax=Calidithermus chliarophilus TaxID=52023 RepID=UPI0012F65316